MLLALHKWVCCQKLVPEGKPCPVCARRDVVTLLADPGSSVAGVTGTGLVVLDVFLPLDRYEDFLHSRLGVLRSIPHGVEDLWADALAEQFERLNHGENTHHLAGHVFCTPKTDLRFHGPRET